MELSGLRVVCIAEEVASGDAEVVGRRVREIGNLAEQCVGPGVVVSFGDLKGMSPHYSHDTHATNDD